MSDHNLIFIIYGDTHGQSFATLLNYRYDILYWYNKKEITTRCHCCIENLHAPPPPISCLRCRNPLLMTAARPHQSKLARHLIAPNLNASGGNNNNFPNRPSFLPPPSPCRLEDAKVILILPPGLSLEAINHNQPQYCPPWHIKTLVKMATTTHQQPQ